MELSKEEEAMRLPEGENVTWFIGFWWPRRRERGFMEGGDQR